MSDINKRQISISGPDALSDIKTSNVPSYAAGIPAVKVALGHAMKEMGLAKSIATLSKLNQKDGFDCPGCAWPDPDHRSSLGEFCENGVKAVAEEATNKRVDLEFFEKHSVVEMSHWTDFKIGKSGRLTEPIILKPGSDYYQRITWEEAFSIVADNLKKLNDPNEAIFYTSGRSSNEAAFLYGLFIRAFGTNNMPDCSNMCHESSGVALGETLGIGKGSVTLDDFEDAEVVMVIGQNPGTNHPRMLTALSKCKDNGGSVISVNPLEEAGLIRFKNPQNVNGVLGEGTGITDIHLQVKINQDVPLLKLIMKRLAGLEAKNGGVFDHSFIKEKTSGYEELLKDLDTYNDAQLLEMSGVAEEKVEATVQLLASKKRIIICWAMGLTQHKNGVQNIKECVNLLLLKGSIGIKGGGTCPVRGHSNVQGDRTVGIMHHVSPRLNASFKRVFDFDPPQEEGMDVVKSIKAMHEGRAKVFIALGGNFLSAASDTLYTGEALQKCELTVSISTKLNRSHLTTGKTSLILPTLGRTEQDQKGKNNRYVTVENSMGKVHRSQGRLKPASDYLLSEPEIVTGIAQAYFGNKTSIPWKLLGEDYDLTRSKMSEIFQGFTDYSKRSKGGGFYLPNHTRKGDFTKLQNGRASFSVCQLPKHNLSKNEFLLMTIRSHDQYNTTIYGLDDRYRGIYNERRVVFINNKQAQELGFKKFDCVDLISNYNNKERRAKNFLIIPYNIPRDNLAAYFPETNVLIPIDEFADKSFTPISKSVKVFIQRVG